MSGGNASGRRRYVELHLVTDTRLYRHFKGNQGQLKNYSAQIIAHTNALFEPLDVSVVLQRLEVWREDRTSVHSNYSRTLESFKQHRIQMLERAIVSDVTVLLTKIDFLGTTVGYAIISSMCSGNGVAVVEAHDSSVVSVAHTMAHELGHVLGMAHDNEADTPCNCKGRDCVMASSLNHYMEPRLDWSNCSRAALAAHLSAGHFSCLLDIPSPPVSPPQMGRFPICGDGVVDRDEQCDCGPPSMCQNLCCDPNTCRFNSNATCASGPCCDLTKCRLSRASTVCRRSRSECDLTEYCSGWSEACSNDTFLRDGSSCDDQQGHCVGGVCGSYRTRCQTWFGSGTRAAPDHCSRLNTQGSESQNCGVADAASGTYKRCHADSTMCGSLYCQPLTEVKEARPGVTVWRRGLELECYTAYSTTITAEQGQDLAPDGATCGTGKMCLQQRCVPVPDTTAACGNTAGCGRHGRCNDRGHCHCDAGYAPPDCTGPGYGGSVDSGHMGDPAVISNIDYILYLITLICIPLVCGICIAFLMFNVWWETKKRMKGDNRNNQSNVLNKICCCMSESITKTLTDAGFVVNMNNESNDQQNEAERLNGSPSQNRKTICQVDLDIQTPKPEHNCWGTADDALFTDVIEITPKNSPDMHRRVRLPSNSPLLHHKSNDQLDRPQYHKSFSADSGCISDIDDSKDKSSLNLSMGSLVSVLMKAGRGKRSREGSLEPELRHPKTLNTQKTMPLSRLVVDPYGPKRHSRPESDPYKTERPSFSRSISSDAATKNRIHLSVPSTPKLYGRKSNDSIVTVSSSDDEMLRCETNLPTKQTKKPMLPTNGKPDISPNSSKKPMVPPNKAKPIFPPDKIVPSHSFENSKPIKSDGTSLKKDFPGQPNSALLPTRPAPTVPDKFPKFNGLKNKQANTNQNKIGKCDTEIKKKAMLPPTSFISSKVTSSSTSLPGGLKKSQNGSRPCQAPPKVPLLPKHLQSKASMSHDNLNKTSNQNTKPVPKNGTRSVRDLAKNLEGNL